MQDYGTGAFLSRGSSADSHALPSNPGTTDFPEDDLHEVHRTWLQQLAQSLRYARCVKALLLLWVPLLGIVALSTPESSPAAEAGAGRRPVPLPTSGAAGNGVFWCALLLILPTSTLLIEYVEDLVVRHDSPALGIAVNLAAEHAAELIFSFAAMAHSEKSLCWVKPVLLGCILLHLLGVLGASVLAAPLVDGTSVDLGISSWTAFSPSGLVFASAVFLLPTAYELTVAGPDAADQLRRLHVPAAQVHEQQTRNMLFLSRSLAMGVLAVYSLYLWKVLRSNSNYYVASDNPNAPSSLVYALQYRERLRSTDEVDLGSRYSQRFAVTGTVACVAAMGVLCWALVATLPAARTATPLPLAFTLVILLPSVFEAGGAVASVLMSHAGRPDIAASIAFASIVHLYLFVLPVVVLVGWWVLQAPLELAFHPFLGCCCFVSALVVAQVMSSNRVRWLEGGTLVALYGLIVCICLLGRWHLCTRPAYYSK
ncbi:Sodium/calcium exchanger protein [Novymonas esmeraldas]|uniref:Sodium/calcium exchanger protein n=1 Tax=Novymonas esmeraldas TaxID=1808958 RepID=A0AAW0EPI3_9TRYP